MEDKEIESMWQKHDLPPLPLKTGVNLKIVSDFSLTADQLEPERAKVEFTAISYISISISFEVQSDTLRGALAEDLEHVNLLVCLNCSRS
jgi:hypothetical protein